MVEQFIQCDEQLDIIFQGEPLTAPLQEIINRVKHFYREASQDEADANEIIDIYRKLIHGLERLKNADVANRHTIAEALKRELLAIADEREAQLGRDKIKIIFEISCLLIAAVLIYLSLFTLIAPSFAVHPVLGLLLLTVLTRLYIAELIDHIRDIDYLTPERIYEIMQEEANECSLVNFFLPEHTQEQSEPIEAHGLALQEDGESVSFRL